MSLGRADGFWQNPAHSNERPQSPKPSPRAPRRKGDREHRHRLWGTVPLTLRLRESPVQELSGDSGTASTSPPPTACSCHHAGSVISDSLSRCRLLPRLTVGSSRPALSADSCPCSPAKAVITAKLTAVMSLYGPSYVAVTFLKQKPQHTRRNADEDINNRTYHVGKTKYKLDQK